jgi:hypothetical protein
MVIRMEMGDGVRDVTGVRWYSTSWTTAYISVARFPSLHQASLVGESRERWVERLALDVSTLHWHIPRAGSQ